MKKSFESQASIPTEKVPVNSITIDAIDFVFENVFDWGAHTQHAGLRMTYEDGKKLVLSLEQNLRSTCPDVGDDAVFDAFAEMLHNNWAGEFDDVKLLTRRVIGAYMEAEQGYMEPLVALKREMKGKIRFMESHYSDVGHNAELPVHVTAAIMEKSDKSEPRQSVESLTETMNKARALVDGNTAQATGQAKRKFPGLFKMLGR